MKHEKNEKNEKYETLDEQYWADFPPVVMQLRSKQQVEQSIMTVEAPRLEK